MRSTVAIFIKQLQDTFKNMAVLVQFFVFPGMAFIMTRFVGVEMEGMSDEFFISMFASMFIGMTLISSPAVAIAEDRDNNSLRFLMMSGVKSHQYLMGISGVYMLCALLIGGMFTAMMPELLLSQRLIILASLMLGGVASTLLGAIIGLLSKNGQAATSIGTAVGMFLGFGPMIGMFNERVRRIFSIFYTQNFIFDDFDNITRRLIVILVNIAVLMIVFMFAYGKKRD
ncbi:MAG: ABC transporter permease [Defluviitaleaceae bacterium]|nr:ABC transporter permease [Defluviitaleaceae bacterium]